MMLVALILVAVLATSHASRGSDVYVDTSNGPIVGSSEWLHNVTSFLGVPYAAPPVGNLRYSVSFFDHFS
jgi:hypothetical protein